MKPSNRSSSTRIEIPLASRPRGYLPGGGPPLQRICLLPPQDSTAYIVERILLPSPGPAADGRPLPKRMTYVIGWRDLPAARHLVPAMRVLDYVSPRALEEWESSMETELDEERRKLADEKDAGESKGRPPAHTGIESAAVAEPESATPARVKTGAMSLSTPSKTRLEDFAGLSDDDDESASPSRQIVRETAWYTPDDLTRIERPGLGLARDAEAAAARATPRGARPSASALTSRPAPSPTTQSNAQTPTRSSSRIPSLHDRLSRPQSPAPRRGGFTPLNGSFVQHTTPRAKRPSPEPTHITFDSRGTTSATQSKTRKKPGTSSNSASAAQPALDANGERAWVVRRLEDTALYDVEGRGLVRYFQVRWEGDWPPDENPTWEPEENIPENMVANFFKRGKKRKRASSGPGKARRAAKTTLGADMHYKSVGEAFAGEIADDPPGQSNGADDPQAGGDGNGELFVIEEDQVRPAKPAMVGSWLGLA